ncbi:MAG: hypothetical protein E6Q88_11340 [Lysobacteraceae bacterium]|nr:MAG: hypothetical protein E6Q88_11340 [Xanthomonadaceae bacterium]
MDKRDVPQAALDALMRGDKIEAIKLIREATGGDLKGALDMAQRVLMQIQQNQQTLRKGEHAGPHHVSETQGQRENRERTQNILSVKHTPTVMPGDSGGRGVIWLLLIGVAAVVFWLFGQ